MMNRRAVANFIGISFSVFYFLTFFYIVFLARRRRHQSERHLQLVPFKGTLYHYRELAYTDQAHVYNFYSNLFGNIALFVPLSIILLWLFQMHSKLKVLLIGVLTSFAIETIQFIFKIGYADIDDIILNTTGAAIGILIFSLFKRLLPEKIISEVSNDTAATRWL